MDSKAKQFLRLPGHLDIEHEKESFAKLVDRNEHRISSRVPCPEEVQAALLAGRRVIFGEKNELTTLIIRRIGAVTCQYLSFLH
jgi:hypothetical protein